ncbi:MAG: phosphate uptake regulator PhoU [Campylobacteraceae bacterium]|jgi:phosphate transport system protein|nr:phosphate uptake regulator PhoU [Campylobacteraceae bacterium]
MLPNFEQKASDIKKDIITMGEFVLSSFEESLQGIKEESIEHFRSAREGNIKHLIYMADSVDNNIIVALALYAPEAGELRELIAMLKTTNELVRIADASKKFSRGMQEIIETGADISKIKQYIIELHTISIRSIKLVIECFKNFSLDTYRAIHIEEEKSDEIFGIIQKEVLNSISAEELTATYIKIIKTIKKHERVTDHCENIARLLHYAKEGGKLSVNI